MQILSGIVAFILIFGIPFFVIFKCYKLVSDNVKFKQEQERLFNSKRIEFMNLKMAIMREELNIYKKDKILNFDK